MKKLFPFRQKRINPIVILDGQPSYNTGIAKGVFFLVTLSNGKEFQALLHAEHRVDKFAPQAQRGDGILVSERFMALLDAN